MLEYKYLSDNLLESIDSKCCESDEYPLEDIKSLAGEFLQIQGLQVLRVALVVRSIEAAQKLSSSEAQQLSSSKAQKLRNSAVGSPILPKNVLEVVPASCRRLLETWFLQSRREGRGEGPYIPEGGPAPVIPRGPQAQIRESPGPTGVGPPAE